MFRRSLRIFCVVGMVVIVGMAVVAQFGRCWLTMPHVDIAVDAVGIGSSAGSSWWNIHFDRPEWSVRNLFYPPRLHLRPGYYEVYLPWWLQLATWGALTVLIFRLTRRRKSPRTAFPIEATTNSGESKP